MPRLVRTIDIAAATDAVWAVISDFGGVGDWAPGVREARWTSESRTGVGCSRSVVGPDGVAVEEVVSWWEEGHGLAFEIPGGIARVIAALRETWCVEQQPQGSTVTVTMEYRSKLGPLGAVVVRMLIRPVLDHALTDNLAGLKRHCETDGQALRR